MKLFHFEQIHDIMLKAVIDILADRCMRSLIRMALYALKFTKVPDDIYQEVRVCLKYK